MALATATITFDIADLLGSAYETRRNIRAWVDTNIPDDTVVDTDGNKIRVGPGKVVVANDGTGSFTVLVPGAGSNPASWQTYLHVEYSPSGFPSRGNHSNRPVRTFGPFTITGNANLADLIEEQEVPPEYAGQLVAQMEALRDQQVALSGIDDTDTAVAYAMEYGTEAAPYLSATSVAPLGKSGTGPNAPLTYFNVKDYGAKGDGATNDTAAVQAAMDAATAVGGGEVAFPRGTYMVNGLVVNGDNLIMRGVGRTASIIKTRSASTSGKLLDCSWRKHITITDLGFDGASHATTLSGVYSAAPDFDKYITVTRCRFVNFMPSNISNTNGAIYAWHASEITVTDSDFVDCGRAINLDAPTRCTVIGNHVTSPANVMATGILVRAAAMVQGKVTVASNYIHGATYDTSGVGTEGHGIAVLQVRDTKIIGNTCLNSGRGVLVSTNGFGAVVEGNVCNYNTDAGIRIEPSIDEMTTVGANTPRACTVVGNVAHDNVAQGITISYAAASTVANNISHDNGSDGIAIDSDRVLCIGNTCYNNWKTMAPGGEGGTKAGIRNYQGVGVIMVGNTCFDNQTTKTQLYGISIGDLSPVIFANALSGNATADIDFPQYIKAGFYGKAPVAKPTAVPVTAAGVHAALVTLGLISA